jgi:DNA polymerase, archaea type
MYGIVGSSYIRTEDHVEIVLVCRDENGKRRKLNFKTNPYFYVRESEYKLFLVAMSKDIRENIISTEHGFYGIDGYKLVKVTVTDPSFISQINQTAKTCNLVLYESNIPFNYRFLIDHNLLTGINPETLEPVEVASRHKKCLIDIEVLSPDNQPPDWLKHQLIVIGLFDWNEKKYHIIYIGKRVKIDTSVILSADKEVILHPCKDEIALAEKFATIFEEISPDIMVSFGDFDMRYLVRRLTYIGIELNFLSPIFNVTNNENRINVHCLHTVDYEELYRKVHGEAVWNTLDYVSKTTLGYGKLKPDGGIYNSFFNNIKSLLEYNLRDVELIRDLEENLGFIDNYLLFIWSQTGLDLEDCFMANRIGDICHIRYLKGKYILKSESDVKFEKYDGGLVVADEPGLHFNVGVFDWNELYPSIMEIFHISMDTLDEYGDIILNGKISERCYHVAFSSKIPGWTNEIIKPFRNKRKEYKKQASIETTAKAKFLLKVMSQALKVISNAQYGLYGQKTEKFTSRFYDPHIAGAITFIGRDVTLKVKEIVDSIGYVVVYRDTDSCFILLQKNIPEEIEYLRNTIQDKVNDYIHEKYHVTGNLRLDLEYKATKLLILVKKRYIGIKENGDTIVKGLNIVRKDQSVITVEEQKIVSKMRLDGASSKETTDYINLRYNDVKHKRVPVEKLFVLGRCNKKHYDSINRNYKALLYAKKRGIEIPVGSRFKWLYIIPIQSIEVLVTVEKDGKVVTEEKSIPADVIAFLDIEQIPKDVIVDYTRMADYTIRKPLLNFIEKEEAFNTQQTLSKYW